MLRYRLAPYGTEWSLISELGGRVEPMQVELRVGRSPNASPWAVGVRRRELVAWRGWSTSASIEVWQQPTLAEIRDRARAVTMRMGTHVRGVAERPLIPVWFSANAATLIVDIGVKAAGFVPGEPLGGGAVVRAGVGLPLR